MGEMRFFAVVERSRRPSPASVAAAGRVVGVRAAVLHAVGAGLAVEERPMPEPRGEEVLVRVLACGVCHSDVHQVDWGAQRLPIVLGHEISGTTDELGPVLVYAAWGCGRCEYCRRGDEQLCTELVQPGFERDGGYAETVVVPSTRYVLPLEGLDPVHAAPLADGGLTAFRAVRRVRDHLGRGTIALVVGAGGLGQFAIQYLRLQTDARVVALELDERRRARAIKLGADDALPPGADLPAADAVLDFVGTAETLAVAAAAAKREAIVVQIGIGGGRVPFGIQAVPWESTFTTCLFGSRSELADVVELARRGDLDWHVEALPLERANEAIDRLRGGDVLGRLALVP
jgi:alcohol dehydrogenase, propanol-preferring